MDDRKRSSSGEPAPADIAELPDTLLPRLHVEQCYHRYHTASSLVAGRDVLEVACGVGQGLGYLARTARRVVGGDYVARNLDLARAHYGSRIPLLQLDAHALPFAAGSFDVVLIMEAIYLLDAPERFVAEARRVLRPGGKLLVQSTNPLWRDFGRYRFARRYYDSAELTRLLEQGGFGVEMWVAFATERDVGSHALSMLRRIAWRLRVMPPPGAIKDLLRRRFYGSLLPFPREVTPGLTEYRGLERIRPTDRDVDHVYLYAVAERGA